MKIFKLTRLDGVGYDEYDSAVIRSDSEEAARSLMYERAYQGEPQWLDSELSTCEVLSEDGEECIIVDSFNAG